MATAIERSAKMRITVACIVILTTMAVLSGCTGELLDGMPIMNGETGVDEHVVLVSEATCNEEIATGKDPVLNEEESDGRKSENGNRGEDKNVYDEDEVNIESFAKVESDSSNEPKANEKPEVTRESNSSREVMLDIFTPGGMTALYWVDNENVPNIDIVAIPDMETAIDIASAIFRNMQKDGRYVNYVPQVVYYDGENEIWIVSFRDETCTRFIGQSISIALQKSDARVLKIFP